MSRKIAGVAPARTTVAAAGLLLAAGLAACGSGPAGSASSGTSFTYWTSQWQPAEINAVDKAFARAYPGMHARGQYIASSDEYLPKVITAIKSGTQPTVLLDQNPSDLPEIAQSGDLIPLNGKLTAQTSALYPGIRQSLFYRGHQLGTAIAGDGDLALFWNKKEFAAAGITRPPATWTQLMADAKKLTRPDGKQYGIYIPVGDAEWISFDWETLLYADGGSVMNGPLTKTAFDSPAGINALTTWVNLRRDGDAPAASYAQAGSYDGAPAFASGTVAMIIDGQWALPEFQQAGVDFGVAPFPAGTAGEATSIGIGVAALLKTSATADAAGLNFIKFLSTPAEGAYLAAQDGGLPSDPAQLRQPALASYAAKTSGYQVFAVLEKYGKVRPISPAYNSVSQDLWTQINAALQGSETPAQALAMAAREGNAALSGQG
jgi:multiple sugar transport system substrate-binding protein